MAPRMVLDNHALVSGLQRSLGRVKHSFLERFSRRQVINQSLLLAPHPPRPCPVVPPASNCAAETKSSSLSSSPLQITKLDAHRYWNSTDTFDAGTPTPHPPQTSPCACQMCSAVARARENWPYAYRDQRQREEIEAWPAFAGG
jgi:hypothetical protein